jgi:trigger factor
MNIQLETTGTLTSKISIEITPEDYQEKVDKAIKDYQKKATIPGFRPGKVPFGMIKKMVGAEVLADEINKLLNDRLYKYIEEQKLDIFGDPFLNEDKAAENQPESGIFNFEFELAMKPEVDVDIENDFTVPYLKINTTEEEIDSMVERYRKRGATKTTVEVSQIGDVLEIKRLDETGKEDISTEEFEIDSKKLKEEEIEKFIGLKSGDSVAFSIAGVFATEQDALEYLGDGFVEEEIPSEVINYEVVKIERLEPAELTPEFFKEIFYDEEIKTVEDFRNRIRGLYDTYRDQDAETHFYKVAMKTIADKANIELPDELLKKRLVENAKAQNYSEEEILAEYPLYANTLREQLLERFFSEKYEIKVEYPEVRDEVIRSFGINDVSKLTEDMHERFEKIVAKSLEDEKQAMQHYQNVFKRKLTAVLLEKIKKEEKVVSFDEFVQQAHA